MPRAPARYSLNPQATLKLNYKAGIRWDHRRLPDAGWNRLHTTIPNTMNTTNAPYGYIVTATRGLIADGYTPLGVVGEGGSYEYAAADTDTGINLAVYPSPETASAAMVRAARGRDPLVWDGLTIRTLGRAWHESHTVSECVAFGCVTYPDGEPAEKLRAV